jgi:hypothetical protein
MRSTRRAAFRATAFRHEAAVRIAASVALAQPWPGLCSIPVRRLPLSSVLVAGRVDDQRSTVANVVEIASQLALHSPTAAMG